MFEQPDAQVPEHHDSSSGSLDTLQTPLKGPVLTDTHDGDAPVPDYKPFALRWPFLTSILLFICSLIILLVVGLQRLLVSEATSFTQVLLGRQIPERISGMPSGVWATYGPYFSQTTSPSHETSTDTVVVNECRSWYFIRPDDNCTSIATAHNTTTEQLYAWNPSIGPQCASLKPDFWLCVDSPSSGAPLAPRQDWSTIDWSSALSTVEWSTALATVDWSSVFNSFSSQSPIWHCSPVSTMYCCFGTDGIPGACACGGFHGAFTCTCTCGPTGAWPGLSWTIDRKRGYAATVTTTSTSTGFTTRSTATRTEAIRIPSPLSSHVGLTTPQVTAIHPAKSLGVSTFEFGDQVSSRMGGRAKKGRSEPDPVGQQSPSNASSQTVNTPPRPTNQTSPGTVMHTSIGSYFVNMFMPVLLGTLLHIPIHILSENVKLFQPLHEMTQRGGAPAQTSLLFSTFGWRYRAASLRLPGLRRRSLLPLLTLALDIASNISIALSATAVGFQLRGGCRRGDPASVALGCGLEPSISRTPALLLVSVLAVMALLVCVTIVLLARWRTGVSRNPWSLSGMRTLSLHQGLRVLLQPMDQRSGSRDFLKSYMFMLGYFKDEKGQERHGIIPNGPAWATTDHVVKTGTDKTAEGNPDTRGVLPSKQGKGRLPIALGYVERSLFLVFLSGLIILIVYYHNVDKSSTFEDFMDGETFGVKFLFALLGTIIISLWWSFFETVAIISPYHCLSSSSNTTMAVPLTTSRPTNAFSGLHTSLKHRHPFLAVVSLVAMAAEFLPIFLANVPYNMSELKVVYQFSYWVTLCVVGIMVLLIAASFLIRWTRLPADPSTLAGAIHLAVDGDFLEQRATGMDNEGRSLSTTA